KPTGTPIATPMPTATPVPRPPGPPWIPTDAAPATPPATSPAIIVMPTRQPPATFAPRPTPMRIVIPTRNLITPTSTFTPTPPPIRDTAPPTISNIRAIPNPVSYSTAGFTRCISATTLIIRSNVSDRGSIASVVVNYFYHRLNNTPTARRPLSVPMTRKLV